ncbi:transposase domain-containing protein [Gluconobacter sp. Dm-73]
MCLSWLRDVLTRVVDGHPVARIGELLPMTKVVNG